MPQSGAIGIFGCCVNACCAECQGQAHSFAPLLLSHQMGLALQVPKIGRRFVKPDDIAFIDETEYAPKSQTQPPYKLKINSLLPLLGDRVQPVRLLTP